MPRHARLVVPGVALHVVHRGHDRKPCFRRDGDYLVYLALLRQACARFGCALHAYCLMTNHVHLLVTPSAAKACGAMMHGVAQRYAYYFNADARTGALWEGRYRSCIVESGRYVLACYRYIELNPVRAAMVSHPGTYPWSSFAGNAGTREDALLTPHAEFAALSRSAYLEMIAAGIDAPFLAAIRESVNGGYPLATEEFKTALEKSAGRRVAPARAGRPPKTNAAGKSVDVPDFLSAGGAS
ncbi:MAG TPA: transposase [Burkholderiales bacterium]|nr:transposase [Burkholderiales bacterium]